MRYYIIKCERHIADLVEDECRRMKFTILSVKSGVFTSEIEVKGDRPLEAEHFSSWGVSVFEQESFNF